MTTIKWSKSTIRRLKLRTGKNIRKRADGRYEARYIKGRNAEGKIIYGYCYGSTYEEAESKRSAITGAEAESTSHIRHMSILILGHGDHGMTAADLCESLRIFEKIDFLDDFKNGDNIVGKCADYRAFLSDYPLAYPGFGDNKLRMSWFSKLQEAGFIVPTLVHPTALISPSAKIGEGSIVEARATVNSGAIIGKGCIISTNTTVDVAAEMGDFVYTDPGIIISRHSVTPALENVVN